MKTPFIGTFLTGQQWRAIRKRQVWTLDKLMKMALAVVRVETSSPIFAFEGGWGGHGEWNMRADDITGSTRGNYRQDVFGGKGAAEAFERVLAEAMKSTTSASSAWLARRLHLGSLKSVSQFVDRWRKQTESERLLSQLLSDVQTGRLRFSPPSTANGVLRFRDSPTNPVSSTPLYGTLSFQTVIVARPSDTPVVTITWARA